MSQYRQYPPALGPFDEPFDDTQVISPRDLARLAKQIRPIGVRGEVRGWLSRPSDLRRVSYLWGAQVLAPVVESLEFVDEVTTFHTFGYHGLFKPSLAEVYTAINKLPRSTQDTIHAFELLGPETADDLNHEKYACDAGYHVGHARLYRYAEHTEASITRSRYRIGSFYKGGDATYLACKVVTPTELGYKVVLFQVQGTTPGHYFNMDHPDLETLVPPTPVRFP